jgi:hypothetical protein
MPRLLGNQIAIDDSWHPLSGHKAPEYVPPFWIGPHVGLRLVEAFRTLQNMPINGVPSGFVNSWPEYRYSWTDELAQAGADQEQQQSEAKARNYTKINPSAQAIARMEQAIVWPARYLAGVPQLLRTVGPGVIAKSRNRPLTYAAERLRMPARLFRRWYHEGLDLIAEGLRRNAVGVF